VCSSDLRSTPEIGDEEELGSQRASEFHRRTNPLVHTWHGVPTDGDLSHRGGLPREAGGLRSVLPVTNVCSIRYPRLLWCHTKESRYSVLLRLGHELQSGAGLVHQVIRNLQEATDKAARDGATDSGLTKPS